jgi:hypothetical protein
MNCPKTIKENMNCFKGKYKISINNTHKLLLEYLKDYPNLTYYTKEKRFVTATIPIINFEFIYKDSLCYFSFVENIIKHSHNEYYAYIHGDNLEILKEFAILIDEDDDKNNESLYT